MRRHKHKARHEAGLCEGQAPVFWLLFPDS